MILLSSVRILGLHTPRDYEKYDFDTHQVRELRAALDELTPQNYREVLHDATALRNLELLENPDRIEEVLAAGAQAARIAAMKTLDRVRHAVGLT